MPHNTMCHDPQVGRSLPKLDRAQPSIFNSNPVLVEPTPNLVRGAILLDVAEAWPTLANMCRARPKGGRTKPSLRRSRPTSGRVQINRLSRPGLTLADGKAQSVEHTAQGWSVEPCLSSVSSRAQIWLAKGHTIIMRIPGALKQWPDAPEEQRPPLGTPGRFSPTGTSGTGPAVGQRCDRAWTRGCGQIYPKSEGSTAHQATGICLAQLGFGGASVAPAPNHADAPNDKFREPAWPSLARPAGSEHCDSAPFRCSSRTTFRGGTRAPPS